MGLLRERKRWKFASVLLLAIVLISGCAGGNGTNPATNTDSNEKTSNPSPSGGKAGSEQQQEEPLEISMLNITYSTDPIRSDHIILQNIEKYTNTKLNVTWIPNTAYNDRVNVMVSSGELPDIVLVRNHKTSAMINAAKSGMFWDLTDYISEYPNLSKHPQAVYENASIDGRTYGIPRYRELARYGMVIRQDWLDNLNLDMPKTTDELLAVARAFAKNDPDGNNAHDTYGFLMRENLIELRHLATMLGAPNGWGEWEGQLVPDFMTTPFMEAMNVLREFHKEKILNQEFAVTSNNQMFEMFSLSKGGLYLSVLDDSYTKHDDLYKLTPEAELNLFARIEGPQGIRLNSTEGYNGIFMVSRNSVKTEEHLRKILRFLDQLGDEEMENLFKWGVEGVHYEIVDGKPQQDAEKFAKDYLEHIIWSDLSNAMKGDQPPLVEKYTHEFENNRDVIVSNPTWQLYSATQLERGGNLDKLIRDAQTRYIMGQIDEQGWHAAVEQWKSEGGEKVMQEYNEDYVKNK